MYIDLKLSAITETNFFPHTLKLNYFNKLKANRRVKLSNYTSFNLVYI